MFSRSIGFLGVALLTLQFDALAAPTPFEGSLQLTPPDPAPINVGAPGVDLLAEWQVNKDLTRFEWKINGFSQGVSNVTGGEESAGDEVRNFEFQAPGDYEVCFHIYHHQQTDRDLESCVMVSVIDATCAWHSETAWSDGAAYNLSGGGNWATYTPYSGAVDVDLYAGQTMYAGTVAFSAPSGGVVTVTIELDSGWQFANVDDNVKIQDYDTAPSGNPAPGQFDTAGTATGSSYSIDVPENDYYGVHVDVVWCELQN